MSTLTFGDLALNNVMKLPLWKFLDWGTPVCGLCGMSVPGTTAGPWDQQLFTEGGSPWENQAGKEKGQKEIRKTPKSKMKRLKDRVRVGSRKTEQEVVSTEKSEQKRQITICLCTYPETEGLPREGQTLPAGHCTGEGAVPWVLYLFCLPRKAISRSSEALHKVAPSAHKSQSDCKICLSGDLSSFNNLSSPLGLNFQRERTPGQQQRVHSDDGLIKGETVIMEWYGSSQVEIPQSELIYVPGSEVWNSFLCSLLCSQNPPQNNI